ncbi:MAG: thioredoxin domain-containing protein [Clostridia bacterium]|nr:thioredoxin domain-containing protein [Clostridia bacterium]
MSNRLEFEVSPYLLQHKDNPVDWYPWGEEAFEKAKNEDKPIFLSIGYSSCHWCHVIAHESFEDEEIAELLNRDFIAIKVDKEERPDIDAVYMSVCQAITGNGGWPTSIFMTPDKKPFFAGTYFPKTRVGAMIGLRELLIAIKDKWDKDRASLIRLSEEVISGLNNNSPASENATIDLAHIASQQFKEIYDEKYGGFGRAPKFPTPHNILFLLSYYEKYKDKDCLKMAENTLIQMYRGGLFDHIGFGFSRYSTDKKFLVPHFEKMLYDNALLILAYLKAFEATKNQLYLDIAEKTASYILEEMTSDEGGFYSAQDADSEGEEGKYYLFTPNEIISVLGEEKGKEFNRHFDITEKGNFECKSIPNLLKTQYITRDFSNACSVLKKYRKTRYFLHRDDKILTSWNGLMISAMCKLYLASGKENYLNVAKKADSFIKSHLKENNTLFVSYREGKRGAKGFLGEYSSYIFAQLELYNATNDKQYLDESITMTEKVIEDFSDTDGGFYLYGAENEELILKPKETYDGAIPSGNSLMAYNLVKLAQITDKFKEQAAKQLDFVATDAIKYPVGYSMLLVALLEEKRTY